MQDLRRNLDKLRIRDNVVFATQVSCSAQLGYSVAGLLDKDSQACDEAVSCSVVSRAVIVQNALSVLGAESASHRCCKCNGTLCVELPELSMSPALGKVKRTESEPSIGPTVPTFRARGRNDSAGYYVSLLQSLKPHTQSKTRDCDSPHSVASAEYNSLLSSNDIPKRQTAVLWGLKSSEESGQLSSLAQLADRHSKQLEPKSSDESGQFSSLAQLADRHLKILESKPSDKRSQFSSLTQLGKIRSKILKPDSSEESSHLSSLTQFANKRSLEADRQSSEGHSSSSLAELADKYGKLPHTELTSQPPRVRGQDSVSSFTSFPSDHLEVAENKAISSGRHVTGTQSARASCCQTGYVDSKTSSPRPTEEEAVPQGTGEPARDRGATSHSGSSAGVEPGPAGRTLSEEDIEMDLEIDFTDALISPGSRSSRTYAHLKPEITCWESEDRQQEVRGDSAVLDTNLTSTILRRKLPSHKRRSPFGRTLCREWRRLSTPYIPPQKQSLGTIVRFAFDTLSPDDRALEARPYYMRGTVSVQM
jgi:hypothetical protein